MGKKVENYTNLEKTENGIINRDYNSYRLTLARKRSDQQRANQIKDLYSKIDKLESLVESLLEGKQS
jgi:hypothetical protein